MVKDAVENTDRLKITGKSDKEDSLFKELF
jgi:hypothetical protein